ncbi:hypothetical protein [Azospirillum agricola]|uniref:hypothetical protein n=1 Tax=Azospirillum agricola TaxID=1720247 RepID=UPI000A0EF130|nr:hypothetical protein [Azospirillum agricola]SMH60445.1 hypothetical protein SAMN02982994_5502 [Azospirillum lipoferum]
MGETVSTPAVTIFNGHSVSLCGVRVEGLPGLSVGDGTVVMRVEPPPARRPGPRLVYSEERTEP